LPQLSDGAPLKVEMLRPDNIYKKFAVNENMREPVPCPCFWALNEVYRLT